ncbi:tumor necrosis factor receptor superfamily member 10B isoform X2 [Mus pahari]|uniref:tumor necrosis factor receptor superfamily member 10B isoform X2 n=1 Tax=Mus pahari TaxID=10093 RepID=UPI001114AF51|nr:tumor necrosis factor receptor superfamily member 10B isoform X2 [Mus pahari]
MKPPGASTRTASAAARADHQPPGLGPLPKLRLRTILALFLLLVVSVPVTAKSAHDRPADPQRLEESPSGRRCQAGQYLSEEGCKPCREGIDYTSHSNSLASCLSCSVCKEGHEQHPENVSLSLLDPQTSSKTSDSHHNTEPGKTQSTTTGRKLLVPANGNDSAAALKFIFEYCSNEVPFNSWDRFMRQLGLSDNQIQMVRAETPVPREVLYQMLLKWLHQTGRSASIDHLLDALEAIGERDALEKIEDYAVKSGRFIYQNAAAQAGAVAQETGPGGSL